MIPHHPAEIDKIRQTDRHHARERSRHPVLGIVPNEPLTVGQLRRALRSPSVRSVSVAARVFFGDELTWIATTKASLLASLVDADPDAETEFVLSSLGDIEPSA